MSVALHLSAGNTSTAVGDASTSVRWHTEVHLSSSYMAMWFFAVPSNNLVHFGNNDR